VHLDILVIHAAALTDLLEASGHHEIDRFVADPRRHRPSRKSTNVFGLIPGFLQKLPAASLGNLLVADIAHQSSGQFDYAHFDRRTELFDNHQFLIVRYCYEHDGLGRIGALDIFPIAVTLEAKKAAFVQQHGGLQ